MNTPEKMVPVAMALVVVGLSLITDRHQLAADLDNAASCGNGLE